MGLYREGRGVVPVGSANATLRYHNLFRSQTYVAIWVLESRIALLSNPA
jgi:hypothetical protein